MVTRFNTKNLTTILFSLVAVTAVWDAALWLTEDKTTVLNYLFNLVYGLLYFFGAFVCFRGAKMLLHVETGRIARAFRMWGFALLAWGVGQVVWSYYNLVLKVETPYPSWADLFFVLFYIPLGIGMLQLKTFVPDKNAVSRIFSVANLPVVIVLLLVIVFVFLKPDLAGDLPLLERLLNLSYALGDAFLISIALTDWPVIVRDFKFHYNYLVVALLLAAVGDIIFTVRTAEGTYWNGGTSDVFFALFPAVFTYGVIRILQDKSKNLA